MPQLKIARPHELLSQFIFSLLEPPKEESVVNWVETNAFLPTGAIRGRVSMALTPYASEILERFGDRKTRNLVMCFATQSAKTTILMLGELYKLCKSPVDTMWVLPSSDLAKSFSKARWMKMIEECPQTLNLIRRTVSGEIDRHLYSFTEQHFVNQFLKFVGSNSPANLSSFPCGTIIMDETDKYGEQTKYEAAALDTAQERIKSFPFSLCVKASTPTTAGRMIWPEFLKTDARYFWLPCPRCGKKILLKFTQKTEKLGACGLRWWRDSKEESQTDGEWDLKKVAKNAFYRCQECAGEIQDYERSSMLGEGAWRPSNLMAEEGNYGYHLSSLYSILSQKTSLGSIAVQWLLAKGNLSARQNFINSWLAETWDADRMYDHKEITIEDYRLTDLSQASTAVFTIDVQADHYWALIRRWTPPSATKPNGESWLLFADRVETEEELVKLQQEHSVAGENVVLDMAHRPNEVGKMIIAHDWRGMLGTDTKTFWHREANGARLERMYSPVLFRDPHLGTAWQNRTLDRARYVKFCNGSALDLVSSLRYSDPPIWHVSANVSDRYQRHLNSRVKIQMQNKRTGRMEFIWKDLHQENHLSDCEKMNVIRAVQLGLISLPSEATA